MFQYRFFVFIFLLFLLIYMGKKSIDVGQGFLVVSMNEQI